jgi:hypothetical protein
MATGGAGTTTSQKRIGLEASRARAGVQVVLGGGTYLPLSPGPVTPEQDRGLDAYGTSRTRCYANRARTRSFRPWA